MQPRKTQLKVENNSQTLPQLRHEQRHLLHAEMYPKPEVSHGGIWEWGRQLKIVVGGKRQLLAVSWECVGTLGEGGGIMRADLALSREEQRTESSCQTHPSREYCDGIGWDRMGTKMCNAAAQWCSGAPRCC